MSRKTHVLAGKGRFLLRFSGQLNVYYFLVFFFLIGAVWIDDTVGTFNTMYSTPATLALGTTKWIEIKYVAPMLTVSVEGVACNPSVNVSVAPYSISGALNIAIGSDTNGLPAYYSNIVLSTNSYSETPMNLRTTEGATWTASAIYPEPQNDPWRAGDDDVTTTFSTPVTAGPHWLVVKHPYPRVVNKIRIITHDVAGSAANQAPSMFRIRGSNDNGTTWTDVYTRTVANNWNDANRAIDYMYTNNTGNMYQDTFYFPNNTPYETYRIEDANIPRMFLAALDMFYVDPAGVDVVHYEARYSTPMPRLTDAFTDRNTFPRSLSCRGYQMTTALTSVTAFSSALSPITPSGDFTIMIPLRIPFDSFTSDERLMITALNMGIQIRYQSNILRLYGAVTVDGTLPDKASK
jgi:hypothetical protein